MPRALITGMSGTGKTTLLNELARRGHDTVDTDYDGWTLSNGLWDESRMAALLEDRRDLFVSGTVENQGLFYEKFEHIILLSAPTEVLIARVSARTNNPYGRSLAQQADIRKHVADVEPLLRAAATTALDGERPVIELADELERLVA